ncbi:caspase family protein [Kibdelosporangium persicum]|uniref:Translation initiation factor IF-2 n=1 Tax=Kibdelosporangium persicum TaxID=2698649 RepID=A0ABX2F251_9PSEU|nr:caspase family protein [Kibdelosporangium persicum]NRN65298.1 Translation initiation factor IF-2 [Kibdelosporangium persicum]
MTRLPDPLRSRAILIGAATYIDPELDDLPSVRNNVADLAAILTSDRGTGLPAEHCTVIEADFESLGDRVEQAVAEADDLLLLYYAGHGLIDSQGRLHLALPSTRLASVLWTALPFDTIRESLSGAKARTRVVILDCCYSGRAIGHMTGPALAGQLDVDGTYTLTATARNQPALAPPGAAHTAFTGELITLLANGDAEGDDLLTLGHVYHRLRQVMHRRNLPQPERCGTRTADLLALAPNAAKSVTVARTPVRLGPRKVGRRVPRRGDT